MPFNCCAALLSPCPSPSSLPWTTTTTKAGTIETESSSTKNKKYCLSSASLVSLLAWYALFGVVHEGFHVLAAYYMDLFQEEEILSIKSRLPQMVIQAALGRYVYMPYNAPSIEENEDVLGMVHHAGWIGSVLLALSLYILSRVNVSHHYFMKEQQNMDIITFTAAVTALEAIFTDGFGYGTVAGMGVSQAAGMLCYCGNFGIILLQAGPLWEIDSEKAMDLLEKMIEITMMRGAQTGGVVAWMNNTGKKGFKGVRNRVVAGKRTDLAKDLRKLCQSKVVDNQKVILSRFLYGHTRFATSTKATMEGTHPHQWTPPELRRVYPLDDAKLWENTVQPEPIVRLWENFITHNGDLDFYKIGGEMVALSDLQVWLEQVLGHQRPCSVDSAAIAGVVDILRTAGCFGLSLRYAICMVAASDKKKKGEKKWTAYKEYENVGLLFEEHLKSYCFDHRTTLKTIKDDASKRQELSALIHSKLSEQKSGISLLAPFLQDAGVESGTSSLYLLVNATVDAFFDNDLFTTTKTFLKNAVGSFGLAITCSEDAGHQACIAARGQPMSVAFYPRKGLICYGSELAAVKAGLLATDLEKGNDNLSMDDDDVKFMDGAASRLDLDDLGGEVVLMDWSKKGKNFSLTIQTHQEGKIALPFVKRIVPLENNDALLPVKPICGDLIMADLGDIPGVIKNIQDDWAQGGNNRMSAWNLGRLLRQRLVRKSTAKTHQNSVDILVTGCEVSLWLGEQFACDLKKAFPRLDVRAVSSNKLLSVFGQDLASPTVGFPMTQETYDLHDTVVIIVSHSGGTFAPLATANLLQSFTRNIFVVASEWDTQVGKALRDLSKDDLGNRIFSTNIGIRPAEPCSLSVVATHQILTQLFEHISLLILKDQTLRHATAACVTISDLGILERCNKENVNAMMDIVGTVDECGRHVASGTELALRDAGSLWADHVLENARAYLMTFVYIVVTVTIGYPIISGIAAAAGLPSDSNFLFLTRFLDAMIYFFLPQINVIIIRLWQGRNILHRMVGRTVVIGDIPWVAQSADAFLSKIFARSYSIAGLTVLHGNPADQLVHRHTHRVVRGSLLVCGRPDGRLPALNTAECSVNLSVCQASSIQSIGGTCESITIGHNPSNIALAKRDIFLKSFRPQFLSEHLVSALDRESSSNKKTVQRSTMALKGLYMEMQKKSEMHGIVPFDNTIDNETKVLQTMIRDREGLNNLKKLFLDVDKKKSGEINIDQFIKIYKKANLGIPTTMPTEILIDMFREADIDETGVLTFDQFCNFASMSGNEMIRTLQHAEHRDDRGLMQVKASDEKYFGEQMEGVNTNESGFSAFKSIRGLASSQNFVSDVGSFSKSESQNFAMELYESRIASMQRFVSMCVMFHEMGKTVEEFFPRVSFGILGYRIDRTHSIMRIATTASPVSGDAVRERMEVLRLQAKFLRSASTIQRAWHKYFEDQKRRLLQQEQNNSLRRLGKQPSLRTESEKRNKLYIDL